MNQMYLYTSFGILTVILVSLVAWFLFLRPPTTQTPLDSGFGVGDNRSVVVTPGSGGSDGSDGFAEPAVVTEQMIFKIADGPIAGATLIETTRPTTTVARYIKQDNGHVFDLVLDSPGAIPRALSNTTIPGVFRVVWAERGNSTLLQYLSDSITKTVYLGFPVGTTTATTTRPIKIQFLPDNILDIATSPDGKSVSYLLRSTGGVNGFTAKSDGSGSKQLFSLPLSQVRLSWPAQGALLITTKSASGVPGIAFSVNSTSGLVTPLMYAEGLTATADRSFSRIVYQINSAGGVPSTYSRSTQNGTDTALSFDPYPEKCIWSVVSTTVMYCSAPIEYVPPNFLDLWHLGVASVPDSIFSFDVAAGRSSVVAIPGSRDGGVQSDIIEMALSPNENYLLFIAKGDRTLWGVRAK